MNSKNCHSRDPDIIGSMKALERAARAARRLSIATGTPFLVMKAGKIVDLNRGLKKMKRGQQTGKKLRRT